MNNDNKGGIWRNEKKETDRHPDFTGNATVNGIEYRVSAWKRDKDANPKSPALRFAFTPKNEQQSKPPPKQDDPDDSIPF